MKLEPIGHVSCVTPEERRFAIDPSKWVPTEDKILARPIKGEDVTSGGIVIPDSVEKKTNRSVVVAVGPGAMLSDGTRRPMQVRPGQTIVHGMHAGIEVRLDDSMTEPWLSMVEDEVLAVIEEDPSP